MYNKFIIAIAVIALGILAGWYVMGGKGNVPQFPKNIASFPTSQKNTSQPQPTSEPTNLYQYREQKITGLPQPTGTVVSKGGVVNQPVTPTVATKITNQKNTITYTNSGFAPMVLTVKINTKVQFMNSSDYQMRISPSSIQSSDILVDLDQKQSSGKGSVYDYIFTKIGTWKYINHEKSEFSGIVIVVQ